jgi:glycosyltransferase involved in cell wall biosynthesis
LGRRIAFLMEQTLGSITHYLNLRRAESVAQGFVPAWIPVEFRHGRLPWTLTGSILARRALSAAGSDLEGCFVHTTTIALFTPNHLGSLPTVLSTDGTLVNKRHMRSAYGLAPQTRLGEKLKSAVYQHVFKKARGFVAWSNWAKASFIEDYGCREEDVVLIPPGIDLAAFSPGDRAHELPRILFVGGDFERKGGDLLVDVFRKRLRGRAELELVTRGAVAAEPDIRVHRSVAPNSPELRRLYADSDIFVLPTRADCYSLVCMEALAAGMPLVVTRMGGIPDLVREGETGHLIEADDGAALGDALESLVSDPRARARMGALAREEAQKRFGAEDNARKLFDFVRSRCGAGPV